MTSDHAAVILLGTGTPLPNPDRACASTLVTMGGRSFLIDTGRGFLNRLAVTGLADVSLVLFTHFHSDHFGEFGEFLVYRAIRGATQPVAVIGPPGTRELVEGIVRVYEPDTRYRGAHHGEKWSTAATAARVREAPSGVVYHEDGLRITMFPVSHPPVTPAVGYRFDYAGRSVVISGDTERVPQMEEMARGVDVLVHEAANPTMTENLIKLLRANPSPTNERQALMAKEMLAYHTTVEEAAAIAAAAEAKKLVLTHLVPNLPQNDLAEKVFVQGLDVVYSGPIVVGRDGMRIDF